MTDLSEAYEGSVASQQTTHRLYLGVSLFFIGAVLLLAAIIVAGSGLLTARGYSLGQTRWVGGILGGIGLPAVILGVFTVLPANRRTRSAALIGASLALFGVTIFSQAYPCQWIGTTCSDPGADLTLLTAGVYTLGTLTTVWCLFVGIANFKIRNNPGGTVTMEVTRQGETQVVEVERSELGGLGGIGFLGSPPDGEVATQTNTNGHQQPASSPTSDGGAATSEINSVGLEKPQTTGSISSGVDRIGPETPSGDRSQRQHASVDRYCGSCIEFKYVRTDTGIRPYCGLHDELMDDMDACEDWQSR